MIEWVVQVHDHSFVTEFVCWNIKFNKSGAVTCDLSNEFRTFKSKLIPRYVESFETTPSGTYTFCNILYTFISEWGSWQIQKDKYTSFEHNFTK